MHDNASVYRSIYTKQWLVYHDLNCLECPAKSPDLSLIEIVWGMMVRALYNGGKQYEDAKSLTVAIVDACDTIIENYLRLLCKSITRRLVSVIEKKGMVTNY